MSEVKRPRIACVMDPGGRKEKKGGGCARLNFRHRESCILGQAFHYSPENAFYIFNEQIYFII